MTNNFSRNVLLSNPTGLFMMKIDQVVRLMDEVESIFTQHFANNDRKRAMKFLRPQQHKDSHLVTFFSGNSLFFPKYPCSTYIQIRVQDSNSNSTFTFGGIAGLFTGCFVSLFGIYIILAHLCGIFSATTGTAYMETVYPVFRFANLRKVSSLIVN